MVREYEISGIELVNLKRYTTMIISARVPFGSALLFTKLESSTGRRSESRESKTDNNIPIDAGPDNKLEVL